MLTYFLNLYILFTRSISLLTYIRNLGEKHPKMGITSPRYSIFLIKLTEKLSTLIFLEFRLTKIQRKILTNNFSIDVSLWKFLKRKFIWAPRWKYSRDFSSRGTKINISKKKFPSIFIFLTKIKFSLMCVC